MRIALFDLARQHRDTLAANLAPGDEIVALPDAPADAVAVDVAIASRFAAPEAARVRYRMLQAPGAGVDKIDFAVVMPEAWVCNAYEHEGPIAEYVFAAMLEATVGFTALTRLMPDKGWAGAYFSRAPHGELAGKTIGILGLGHNGQAIARRAKAFDMTVMAIAARRRDSAPDVDWMATPERLGELLERADFLVPACPLSDATRGMIGAAELKRMKPTAVFINVARAEIAVEADLFEALKSGAIAGAVLDPWYRYPASPTDRVEPSRFPFASLANVRVTPHAAAWTDGLWDRRCAFFARNIARLSAGEAPLNIVRAPLTSRP